MNSRESQSREAEDASPRDVAEDELSPESAARHDLDAPEARESSRRSTRAKFLDDLPDHPDLSPLIDAFENGNYAQLRELARALEQRSPESEVLDDALDLVARTAPDPIAKSLLLLSCAFFILLVIWVYFIHVH